MSLLNTIGGPGNAWAAANVKAKAFDRVDTNDDRKPRPGRAAGDVRCRRRQDRQDRARRRGGDREDRPPTATAR